jgi:NAD(P)-dependent dehydrogenase (short-subunit alcohol dehydrogenase family)
MTSSMPAHRPLELDGQTVLVIGGSAGIGLATARRALAEGAQVIVTARNAERLAEAARAAGALKTAASTPATMMHSSGFSRNWKNLSTT